MAFRVGVWFPQPILTWVKQCRDHLGKVEEAKTRPWEIPWVFKKKLMSRVFVDNCFGMSKPSQKKDRFIDVATKMMAERKILS
ncbi:hypothetical protein TNIN_408211 [Trichonephila inaurata madagascariensis]|uniref:Uncharacterized protein n=1 Tax=Trichonephila inaurata madagascariensis TaxID=2747483 RepID=A0A8X6XGJ2_9ARAC|nr:hypothetical protein TNIN_408211 [Trichonephila inaurata madagascariensis]